MRKKKETIKIFRDRPTKVLILKTIYVLLLISILYNVIFLINTTITKNNYLSVFGISFIVTDEDNMKPEIGKSSLIIVSKKQEDDLKIGQNISYVVNGKVRTNKIVGIKIQDGKIKYITKSNKNYYQDLEEVVYKKIIGEEVLTIWGLGFIVKIIQSKLFSIFILIFLILKFIYNKEVYKNINKRRKKISKK